MEAFKRGVLGVVAAGSLAACDQAGPTRGTGDTEVVRELIDCLRDPENNRVVSTEIDVNGGRRHIQTVLEAANLGMRAELHLEGDAPSGLTLTFTHPIVNGEPDASQFQLTDYHYKPGGYLSEEDIAAANIALPACEKGGGLLAMK